MQWRWDVFETERKKHHSEEREFNGLKGNSNKEHFHGIWEMTIILKYKPIRISFTLLHHSIFAFYSACTILL